MLKVPLIQENFPRIMNWVSLVQKHLSCLSLRPCDYHPTHFPPTAAGFMSHLPCPKRHTNEYVYRVCYPESRHSDAQLDPMEGTPRHVKCGGTGWGGCESPMMGKANLISFPLPSSIRMQAH